MLWKSNRKDNFVFLSNLSNVTLHRVKTPQLLWGIFPVVANDVVEKISRVGSTSLKIEYLGDRLHEFPVQRRVPHAVQSLD